ncbi:MAG: hypothetical protein OEY89_15590, partial [Gammaproteobacteria bacterium]|nr:hypothetical protein [Gammaproteobacteria bacterium]
VSDSITTDLIILFTLAILELRRAWVILVKKEFGYYTGSKLLVSFLSLMGFKKLSEKMMRNLEDPKRQKESAITGLVIGFLMLSFVACSAYFLLTGVL